MLKTGNKVWINYGWGNGPTPVLPSGYLLATWRDAIVGCS